MERAMNLYTASYRYQGQQWCVEFRAESMEDADARLKAMTWGRVDGQIMAKVPAGFQMLANTIAWFGNVFGSRTP